MAERRVKGRAGGDACPAVSDLCPLSRSVLHAASACGGTPERWVTVFILSMRTTVRMSRATYPGRRIQSDGAVRRADTMAKRSKRLSYFSAMSNMVVGGRVYSPHSPRSPRSPRSPWLLVLSNAPHRFSRAFAERRRSRRNRCSIVGANVPFCHDRSPVNYVTVHLATGTARWSSPSG